MPLLWAAVFFALAIPGYLTGIGLDFLPYICGLIGGWLCGLSVVNLTYRMPDQQRALWVHLGIAVVSGALLYALITTGPSPVKVLVTPYRELFFLIQMAAIPAIGWVWIAFLGRLTTLAQRPSRAPQKQRTAPTWIADERGSAVEFSAIAMRLSTLGWIIALTIAIVAPFVALTLIWADWFLRIAGTYLIIIAVGLVFALPAYAVLTRVLRRRTQRCTIRFHGPTLEVTVGEEVLSLNLGELTSFTWRTTTDYARVEVRTATTRRSLITGIARAPRGVLPELPPLSGAMRNSLRAAGLQERPARRPGVSLFAREDAA